MTCHKTPTNPNYWYNNYADVFIEHPTVVCNTRSFFKQRTANLNSGFSFSWIDWQTKAKEYSLHYYLPIDVGRIDRFLSFSRTLVWLEMQTSSSKIWTRVTNSISKKITRHYDDTSYFRVLIYYKKMMQKIEA